MTVTTHVAVGTAIGLHAGSPIIGFLLGIGFHFLVDIIPHGDTNMFERYKSGGKKRRLSYIYGIADYLIAFYLFLYVLNLKEYSSTAILTASVAGSILPDLLVVIYEATKTKLLTWFYKLHFFFHNLILDRFGDMKLVYGLTYQAIAIAMILRFA